MIKATITDKDGQIRKDAFDDFRDLGEWMKEHHGTFISVDAYDNEAIRKE